MAHFGLQAAIDQGEWESPWPNSTNSSQSTNIVRRVMGPTDHRAALAHQRRHRARQTAALIARHGKLPFISPGFFIYNKKFDKIELQRSKLLVSHEEADQTLKDDQGEELTCACCLDVIKARKAARTTCGTNSHVFHLQCLRDAARYSNAETLPCPLCRHRNPAILTYHSTENYNPNN